MRRFKIQDSSFKKSPATKSQRVLIALHHFERPRRRGSVLECAQSSGAFPARATAFERPRAGIRLKLETWN